MTRVHTRYDAEELRILARIANADLGGAKADDVVRWASEAFGTRVLVTQSMANTALAHVVHRVAPTIPLVFVDTGYHFIETMKTRDEVIARTGMTVLSIAPLQTVAEQDAEYGPELWNRDPDLCCRLRKVEPMEEMLLGYDAWISGMRKAAAPHRAETPIVSFDERRGVLKINPLWDWSDEDLLAYTLAHDVSVNPLMFEGYPSVGCAPCTKRVTSGQDPRAGRWQGIGKNECGLHT